MGGVWTAFIGWFLLSAARESYVQVELRNTLTGVSAADIMTPDVPTVERNISIDDYVHEVMRTGRRFHIVTGAGRPVGLVTLHSARSMPREEWANTSIQPVMMPFEQIHAASPEEPALGVLQRMQVRRHQPDAGDFGGQNRGHDRARYDFAFAADAAAVGAFGFLAS